MKRPSCAGDTNEHGANSCCQVKRNGPAEQRAWMVVDGLCSPTEDEKDSP